MKKKYYLTRLKNVLTAGVFIASVSLNAQDGLSVDVDFESLIAGNSENYKEIGGGNTGDRFIISWRGLNESNSSDFSAICFDSKEATYKGYGFGTRNENINAYAYVQIQNTGSNDITKISFGGLTSQTFDCNIPYGFSDTGEDADFQSTGASYNNFSAHVTGYFANPITYFPKSSFGASCGSEVSGQSSVDLTAFTTFASVPKYIRLGWTKSLGAWGSSASANADLTPNIIRIRIYTDGSVNTGISSIDETRFDIAVSGREITLSEPGTVEVYSVSGYLTQRKINTQRLFLDNLPNGLYVIKAAAESGKTAVAKVALR